ncbi:MAG TPA: hypothetical protein VGI74_22080 [Streptosporangiaceae bacterium]
MRDETERSEDQAQDQEQQTVEEQEVAGVRHRPMVNQRRHEPVAGSHHADKDQTASAGPHHHAAPGDAVRDMMGGPLPQGDVPDAPATQIAAADTGEEDGEDTRVRYVANAVPGKPDGEVDTRSGYTGT